MMTTTNNTEYQVFEYGLSGTWGVRKLVNGVEVSRTEAALSKAEARRIAKAAAR